MHSPAVSILMPVRNEELYLQAALDSMLRQTLTNWELIVIDDGSRDKTPDILAKAADRDSRIRVLTRRDGGLVKALNKGLQLCNAPLVARMDGDDISHPHRLQLQAAYLDKHPETGLVACSFRHFPRSSIKQGMLAYEEWQNSLVSHELIMRDLFVESPFVHPGIMIRRQLLEDSGGYQDFGWPEDYDLWLRLSGTGCRFARLQQTLFFWRDHPLRATRTMNEYAAASFRSCKALYLFSGFLKGEKSVIMAGAGREGRAWQRLLLNQNIQVSTWLDVDPRRIGTKLHGSPVIRTEELLPGHGKILVAIGVRGAREEFRRIMSQRGLSEGLDFVCVA